MTPREALNGARPCWAAVGVLGATMGATVLLLEAAIADLGSVVFVAGAPALLLSVGIALGGGVVLVATGMVAWKAWSRVCGLGPAIPVLGVVALVTGTALVSGELFAGPQARDLPLVVAYPWALGVVAAIAVAAYARIARSRPGLAAAVATVVAMVAFALDAWVQKGRYPAFHLMLFVLSVAGLVTACVLPGWPVRGVPRAISRVLLVVLPVAGGASMVGLSGNEGVRAELIVRTVHLARVAELVPAAFADDGDGADVPFRWPQAFDAAMDAHRRTVGRLPSEKRPILFVTIDALRADRGPGGVRAPDVMPKLEAWSRGGVRFLRAYAPSVTTWISARSLMTGRYPESFLARTPPPMRVLPAELKRHGYTPFLWSGYPIIDRQSNKWLPELEGAFEDQAQHYTMRRILQRAAQVRDRPDSPPWFQWLHIMEVHGPYHPKPGYERGTTLEALYDGTVAYVDDNIMPLLESVSEHAWVIVAADHGEDLPAEHGFSGHGSGLYEPSIRVPLVIRGPGIRPRDIREPVSLVDLFSTLLGMAGEAAPPPSDGLSLLPALFGDASYLKGRDLIHVDHRFVTNTELRHNPMRAMITRSGKVIYQDGTGVLEAFDTEVDPGEKKNLLVTDPARARALRSRLVRHTEERRMWWDALGGKAPAPAAGGAADRIDAALRSGDLADLRSVLRAVAVEAPDAALRPVLRDVVHGHDPASAAWAAVAMGRLADGARWPSEVALTGPDDDARSMAMDLLIAQPPWGTWAMSVAKTVLPRVDGDAPSRTFKEVAVLGRMGHRESLAFLERMLVRQTYAHGVAEVLRHQPKHLRPELPVLLHRNGERATNTIFAVATIAHHAPRMPGRLVIDLLRRAADTHGDLRFEGSTVRRLADGLIGTITARVAEERRHLAAVKDGDPWRADIYPAAWGVADGVNFVVDEPGTGWRAPPEIVALRRMIGPQATITIKALGSDRRGLLQVVSRRGRIVIDDGGRVLLDVELREGPQTRVFSVPAGCEKLGVRLVDLSPDDIGFRELVLITP